jgi:hypothetical protein
MKYFAIIVLTGFIAVAAWGVIRFSPLFLNSKIERIHEKNLPRIILQKGGVVYCRMKADDFRFPLPPGSTATNALLTSGGFDTVYGTVEARFQGSKQMTADEYEKWLPGKVQIGGWVTAQPATQGLLIKFQYFGDK